MCLLLFIVFSYYLTVPDTDNPAGLLLQHVAPPSFIIIIRGGQLTNNCLNMRMTLHISTWISPKHPFSTFVTSPSTFSYPQRCLSLLSENLNLVDL